MAERPILFSEPMVRAIIEGRKTQTRRVAKLTAAGHVKEPRGHRRWHPADPDAKMACPYGTPGDRLWVREAWREYDKGNECPCYDWCACPPSGTIIYRAGYDGGDDDNWRASIHMPRSASRITLEITDTRIERLHDISESDAAAEGVEPLDSEAHEDREFDSRQCDCCGGLRLYNALGPNLGVIIDIDCSDCDTHRKRFRWLWDSINAKRGIGWDVNPLVWVVNFGVQHG